MILTAMIQDIGTDSLPLGCPGNLSGHREDNRDSRIKPRDPRPTGKPSTISPCLQMNNGCTVSVPVDGVEQPYTAISLVDDHQEHSVEVRIPVLDKEKGMLPV